MMARYYRSRGMRAKPDQGQNLPVLAIDALFLHPPPRPVKVPYQPSNDDELGRPGSLRELLRHPANDLQCRIGQSNHLVSQKVLPVHRVVARVTTLQPSGHDHRHQRCTLGLERRYATAQRHLREAAQCFDQALEDFLPPSHVASLNRPCLRSVRQQSPQGLRA